MGPEWFDPLKDERERALEMDTRFTLNIELGNDAMRTADDVADALERLAQQLRDGHPMAAAAGGIIRDANGNTVGRYETGPHQWHGGRGQAGVPASE